MGCLLSSADAVVSSGDVQRFPVDKTRCDLAPCAFVNLLHGRSGNVHLRGTLLVGLLLQVNQPDDLVFVQRQQDRLGILAPVGAECIDLRYAADPTAQWRSWRGRFPLLFSVYTDYSALSYKLQYYVFYEYHHLNSYISTTMRLPVFIKDNCTAIFQSEKTAFPIASFSTP